MASQPEVTVIIPNYNGKKLLENCIQTLEKQTCTDFKLLVVDNGSDDGSTEVTSSLDLTMLALKENTGFCGAVNEGIRHADTPYVILLNNDTEVLPEFVEELLAAIKKSDRIFSAGAMMIDYHDRERIDNAGDFTRHSDGRWRAERENRWRILTDRAVCFPVAAALSYTAPGCCVKWGRLTSAILHISRMSIWGIGQKSTDTSTAMRPERGCIMWGALLQEHVIMRKRCSSRRAIRCI